jgi:predicted regulator of Ras-like GTPase activity (Roadblock/LC7/MglB family)
MADGRQGTTLAATQQARIDAQLRAFVEAIDGVRTAVLATVDGFALVQAPATASGERLAAMTSAMLALAAAVGRELALGDLEVLMLEAGEGKVLMLALPAPGAPLLLMAACDTRSVIGNVLWSAKECGQKILAGLGD